MAGCGPCPDSCNCQIADEFGVFYPGSGDAGSPIIVPRAIPETVFAAGSADGSIIVTPGGPYGHTPDFAVNVCSVLEESAVRSNGRLLIFSNDADCKPERLRDPTVDEYLGFDPGSGEATWLPLPSSFSLTIDPASTAPVSYGPSGLRVDCCPNPAEILEYTVSDTFEKADFPGLVAVRVIVQAGGGGSGAAEDTGVNEASSAAGGGGGGSAEAIIPVASLAVSETITVGAGGAAGAVPAGAGGTGGTSSFGALVVATGGTGGVGSLASVNREGSAGGTGGAGTVGDILATGSDGGNGMQLAAGQKLWTAFGGSSRFGGIQRMGLAGGQPGIAGNAFGGGAAGAGNNESAGGDVAGAAGAAGVVYVEPIY